MHSTGSEHHSNSYLFIKPLSVQLSNANAALDFLEPHGKPVDLNTSSLKVINFFFLIPENFF